MGCCGQCTHSHPEHVCFVWNISLYFHLWRNWHFSRIIDYMKLMKYWQHWKVPSHPFNAYITWHQIWVVPSDIYRQRCCDRWCHSAQGGATVHNQRWLTLVANLYEHRILWWIFHLQGTDYNGRHLQQVWLPGPRLHYIFWVVSLATYCGDWRQMLPLICMEKNIENLHFIIQNSINQLLWLVSWFSLQACDLCSFHSSTCWIRSLVSPHHLHL